jgi:lambda family phage tail tape measure protein
MATNTLHIRVRSDGTRVVGREFNALGGAAGKLGEKANLASRQIFLLRRAVQTLFAAAGLRAAFRMAESFTVMNNKIRTVINSEKELTVVRKKLLAVSKDSLTSMESIVQLYTRTTRNAKGLGKTENDLLRFTKALAQETVLSGATTIEADNAIRQLTQGMGAAGLKGEELRSVLEQLPTVAEIIADSLGVSIGELRKLGEEGELTGEVIIDAFLKAEDAIANRFGAVVPTVTKSFGRLKDELTEVIGEFDQANGITQALSRTMLNVADNIGSVLHDALRLAGGAALFFAASFAKTVIKAGPLGALLLTLAGIDAVLRRMTGGSFNLGSAFHLLAKGLGQIADFMMKIANALADIISHFMHFQGAGGLGGLFDDYLAGFALKDPMIQKQLQERGRIKGLEAIMNDPETPETLRKAGLEMPEDREGMQKLMSNGQLPMWKPGVGAFAADVSTKIGQLYLDAYNQVEKDARRGVLEMSKEMTGQDTLVGGGLEMDRREEDALNRKLALQTEVKNVLTQIESLSETSGTKNLEVQAQIAEKVGQIKEYLESINPGEGLKNYKLILEELQPLLDKLQNDKALSEQAVALQAGLTSSISKLDEIKEKAEKLRETEKAAALSKVDEVATEADAILVAAAQKTAEALVNAYTGVLQRLSAIAAGAGNAARTESDTVTIGAGGGDIGAGGVSSSSAELQGTVDKLVEAKDKVDAFGNAGVAQFKRVGDAARSFGQTAQAAGNEMGQAFNSIFSSLEDALVGFVTTGKLDFKSLINSIIADLARMVIQMLIIRPLMGFFGGFFGGIFGFSGGGSVGGAFGLPSFAGGGLVSDDPLAPARFATGGRVHGPGTGVSDSVNALLSRDEFVVNAAASRPNMAGLEYLNSTGRMPGGGNVTSVAYAPNVSITVEGNSDRAAGNGAQIAKDFEQQMRAQFNEFVAQEQRPGGAFSKTNDDVL